jgi:hypothetical protein
VNENRSGLYKRETAATGRRARRNVSSPATNRSGGRDRPGVRADRVPAAKYFVWLIITTTVLFGVTFLVPQVRRLFGFCPLHPSYLLMIGAAGFAAMLTLEAIEKAQWSFHLSRG